MIIDHPLTEDKETDGMVEVTSPIKENKIDQELINDNDIEVEIQDN